MKLTLISVFTAIFLLFLVGCGGPGNIYEIETEYRGKVIHCIVADGTDYGSSSGMSCDFVRFYAEPELVAKEPVIEKKTCTLKDGRVIKCEE